MQAACANILALALASHELGPTTRATLQVCLLPLRTGLSGLINRLSRPAEAQIPIRAAVKPVTV